MSQFENKFKIYDIKGDKELFLCEQLAQLKTAPEISRLYMEKFGEGISAQRVQYYKKAKAEIITQMKEKFIDASMNIPIANEKTRLRRTETLYQLSTTLVKKKDVIDSGLRCLKEAREELKGETGSPQTYLQFNQYNELTDEQLVEKKRELEGKIVDLSKVKESEEIYAQK